jgi:hypothetical protein
VGATTTAQLVWSLASWLPEPEASSMREVTLDDTGQCDPERTAAGRHDRDGGGLGDPI